KTPAPLSVIIVTIDTLRPDRMSLYGAARDTTPQMKKWAHSALKFNHAYSAGAWTSLSLSALFRGVYPRRLDWTWAYETNRTRLLPKPYEKKLKKGEKVVKAFALPMFDPHQTLSELLQNRGMKTAAVVDDGSSQFLEPSMNIAGKFESYQLVERVTRSKRGDPGVTFLARKKLKELVKAKEPFFFWAHYFEPHNGVGRRHGKLKFGTSRLDKYDLILQYTDRHVGQLLEFIDRLAEKQNIAVILTADHGERFLKTHRGHGGDLTDANVRVPLLLRGPGITPGTTDALVSLVDIFPTVLAWTNTPAPPNIDGYPIPDLLKNRRPRPSLSETWYLYRNKKVRTDMVSASDTQYRWTKDLVKNTETLTEMATDPLSEKNLIHQVERPELAEAVEQYLEQNRRIRVRDAVDKPTTSRQNSNPTTH
ncbi:MAG: sulfatase-like hydrolase/transferase, partial [Polyangiaceae bacterium]|nr:sulfatase-like hydrolase/transferase [Polyangiaceae bacterium]